MNKMQEKLLDILKWFHRYCEESGLKYYIVSGTMLGAARHKGFIPWDDDIDVAMPRKDYEQMLRDTSGKVFGHYKIEHNAGSQDRYYYSIAKVYDTDTTLIERCQRPIKRGIYLDIFPLDGAGDNAEEVRHKCKEIYRLRKLIYIGTLGISKNRKWYKNMLILISKPIRRCFIDEMRLFEKLENAAKERSFENSEYVGSLLIGELENSVMPKKFWDPPKLYCFEDANVYGVADSDRYLTYKYGDYMKLPPEEERTDPHPYLYCSLDEPYENDIH